MANLYNVSGDEEIAIRTFVETLDAAGEWDKVYDGHIFTLTDDIVGSVRSNLIVPGKNLITQPGESHPSYAQDTGYDFVAASGIQLDINGERLRTILRDEGVIMYMITAPGNESGDRPIYGAYEPGGGDTSWVNTAGNGLVRFQFSVGGGAPVTTGDVSDNSSVVSVRANANSIQVYVNAAQVANQSASATGVHPVNANFILGNNGVFDNGAEFSIGLWILTTGLVDPSIWDAAIHQLMSDLNVSGA